MKTPIAYYGGKMALVHHILPMIPEHDVYTEVFFGGGTVFFAKEPAKNETINDRLDIVINFYRVLKNNYNELKRRIDATLVSRTMHQEALSVVKNQENHSDVDRAWAFWMVCNFSYGNNIGGGIKYSNHFSISVPQSMKNKKQRFTELLVARIENAYIECNDAVTVLKSRDVENAVHYIDPPYINADQGHYKGYTETDFINLMDACSELSGKFILSNYKSEILDHYVYANNWKKKEITVRLKAPRRSGPEKTEVLVWNFQKEKNLFSEVAL